MNAYRAAWALALSIGCTTAPTVAPSPSSAPASAKAPSIVRLAPDVTVTDLGDGVWLHTSYKNLKKWGPFPSNGLFVVSADGVTLVDSAWTNSQTDILLDWAAATFEQPVVQAVVTHAHEDKMGGVAALKARNIATYAHALTNRDAHKRGLEPAAHTLAFGPDQTVQLDRLTVFYPGPGHTEDNIVAAISPRIVFGGCLIRPGKTKSLGNTADADIAAWGPTVDRVAARFPSATLIIPSHGPPGGRTLLDNTARLARTAATR